MEEIVFQLFELIKNKWEVYLPLEGDNNFIILKTVCSKCGENLYVNEKECFSCKDGQFVPITFCPKCGNRENLQI